MQNNKQIALVASAVSVVMLLIALGRLNYSYYQLLRVVICLSSVFLAWYYIQFRKRSKGWLFIVTSIIFNPLAPIYINKTTWQVIDIIVVIAIVSAIVTDNFETKI